MEASARVPGLEVCLPNFLAVGPEKRQFLLTTSSFSLSLSGMTFQHLPRLCATRSPSSVVTPWARSAVTILSRTLHHSRYSLSRSRSFTSTTSMAKGNKEENHVPAKKTGDKEEAHQHQAGSTTHRPEDEWKHREPYRVHDNDTDEKFDVKWEGSCHCGKVTYQLSRDKPLAAKYCHCTTCQKLHGVCLNAKKKAMLRSDNPTGPLSMGSNLPQIRHQLHQRPPRPGVVRPDSQIHHAPPSLQSLVRVLPLSDHGRGSQHDPPVPATDQRYQHVAGT